MAKQPTEQKLSAAIVMAAIEKESKPLIKRIQDFSIKTTADFDLLAKQLSTLKELSKRVKIEEQSITNPLNETLKAVRAHFKPFTDLVANLEAAKKAEMVKFIDQQKTKSKALEKDLDDGKIKKVSTLLRKQTELEVTSANAQIRKIWTLEITNPAIIPRPYLVPDEVLIKNTLREGGKIPGCEWKQVESIAI